MFLSRNIISLSYGHEDLTDWISFSKVFDLPGQNDIEEVIIDTGAIKGTSEPIIVHSKTKTKSEKTSAA